MSNLAQALDNQDFEMTPDGHAYFPALGVTAKGEYISRVNGGEWEVTPNLITNEGLTYMLNTAFGSKPKASNFYIALFSGTASPEPTWTASSFSAVANEVVSLTEGYTNATRPEWKPTDTTTNAIDNMSATNVAKITIATASQITVTGCALLTASNKGSTTGTLISAMKYSVARVFQAGDVFEVGYRLSLTI